MQALRLVILAVVIAMASGGHAMADPVRTLNVKDYRATGDGASDDPAAIQKAIGAAQASGGGVAEFPSGTYLVNSNHPSCHPWFDPNSSASPSPFGIFPPWAQVVSAS